MGGWGDRIVRGEEVMNLLRLWSGRHAILPVIYAWHLSSADPMLLSHTTTGCGKQGFPSAQPYLSHTPAG